MIGRYSLVDESSDAHVQHPALEAAGRQAGARARRRAQPPRRARAARRRVHRRRALPALPSAKPNHSISLYAYQNPIRTNHNTFSYLDTGISK